MKLKAQLTKWVLWGVAALCLTLIWPFFISQAAAQSGYPDYEQLEVNDYAEVLSPEDEAFLRQHLRDLRASSGIEMTILTINSIDDYLTYDTTIEQFATNLFNSWGIGDAQRNDGILILVAVSDREMRIEVGSGYGHRLDAEMETVIDNYMLPDFRVSRYDRGIYRGVRATIFYMTGEWPPDLRGDGMVNEDRAAPVISTDPSTLPTRMELYFFRLMGRFFDWLLPYLLAAGLIVGTVLALAILRVTWYKFRKQRCPECGQQMQPLDSFEMKTVLKAGDQLEQKLGSADHYAWRCPACEATKHASIPRYWRGFTKCPKCAFRALTVTKKRPAAEEKADYVLKVIFDCLNCEYEYVKTRKVGPGGRKRDEYWDDDMGRRRGRSYAGSHANGGGDSSGGGSGGGGSFGGGGSSGGGASGDW